MLQHVILREGKALYLNREDLLIRESAEDIFAIEMDEGKRGRVYGGQEALITQEEFDAWGPDFFTLIGEVSDDQARNAAMAPGRKDRMVRGGMNRGVART